MLLKKVSEYRLGGGMIYTGEWALWNLQRHLAYLAGVAMATMGFLLGLAMAWEKLRWLPQQIFSLLGLGWGAVLLRRYLTRARVQKLQALANNLLHALLPNQAVTARTKSKFIGMLRAAQSGARQASLYVSAIARELTTDLRHSQQDFNIRRPLGACWGETLRWVLDWADWETWAHLRVPAGSITLNTDASEFGMGMHRHPMLPGEYSERRYFRPDETQHQDGSKIHHNIQEVMAAIEGQFGMAMFYNLRGTEGAPITIINEIDNTMTDKLLNKGFCKSHEACVRFRAHHDDMDTRHLTWRGVYRCKEVMDNERDSDGLSRAKSKWYEFALPRHQARQIQQQLNLDPQLGIDLFSEPSNKQTRRFVSREYRTGAAWVDAMAHGWSYMSNPRITRHEWLWAFPPPGLLPKIVTRILSPNHPPIPSLLLIVPIHKGKAWYQSLLRHTPTAPIPAGNWRDCIPPEGRRNADKRATPPNWALTAILISIPRDNSGGSGATT